eukprot:CAMPEP_0185731788 /NCGR_PEP_ID=MMETSP1171-20130828/13921_1 /TAXON_ID=374046 /ORGANISM="Helicotheca tamensis, Strain CCMP826" /LENGTH=186 /DNA_ID=CAMNT_0028401115 /DNA_START=87 /DNA_END=647 /DNA_ORIENTATION=-
MPSSFPAPCVMGDKSIMLKKKHGTSDTPVQTNLRWGCDRDLADRICNFNRHGAEDYGYLFKTSFLNDSREGESNYLHEKGEGGEGSDAKQYEITFYDSNTGKPLFIAPRGGRSLDQFLKESIKHGWPSFRDEEVVWENVRCLPNGEAVSVDGTHLGHNLPDEKGSRYCINLVSVAGNPNDGSNVSM